MRLLLVVFSVAGLGCGGAAARVRAAVEPAAHTPIAAATAGASSSPLLRRGAGAVSAVADSAAAKEVPFPALLAIPEGDSLSLVAAKGTNVALGRSVAGPGWGDEKVTTYPNDHKGVERAASARGYFKFSKQAAVTTFDSELDACRACITFYPEKQDGKRFHAPIPKDAMGGTWERFCHTGPCDLRDPQTQPWGGVIGAGSEAFVDPWGSWWKPPENKQCMTMDPVEWYKDCEPILYGGMENMYDVSRFCSYNVQMSLPPPTPTPLSPFTGVTREFTRLNPSRESCLTVIETQGKALYDDMDACDSNLKELSECCETMHTSLMCVANTAKDTGIWLKDEKGYNATRETIQEPLAIFSKYCTPLCIYDREEFCEHYPLSDICVELLDCPACTRHGGNWCPDVGDCRCPQSKTTCSRELRSTPMSCIAATAAPPMAPAWTPPPPKPKAPPKLPPAIDIAACKYLEMENIWSQRGRINGDV